MKSWQYANRAAAMTPSIIREILKVTERPDIISFAGGLPSPQAFPVQEFREAFDKVMSEHPRAALQYSSSEGFAPLREWVAASLPWQVHPDQVLITTGSQQALDLVGKVMLDMGSRVMTQTPTYLGALQAFSVFEPEVIGLPNDDQGVQIAAMEREQLRYGARFLYLLPTFQNPTGLTLSASRREELASSLNALGLPVVEDNPYGELWFDNPPPAPISSLLPEQSLYLGSFSKVLAPGLRLGYVVAPDHVYPKLLQAKQAADLHSPTLNQRLAYEVLSRPGFLDGHLQRTRQLYRDQCQAMLDALRRHMPEGVTWNVPRGGMFLWLRLPEGLDSTHMLPLAVQHGVAYVPGAAFYENNADVRTMRLSFVTASAEEIDRGIAQLARTVNESLDARRSAS
ncbi:PLP-dependent aminotransferase family protein [Brachymonas sp. G13]|uniref:aminotransferase-like domain-containing protein n=1 Tax=Brachymonas wangyanguii TaxID=3130163 RepID=UPI00307D9966